MAATVMIIEFGTVNLYSSVEERKFWRLFLQFYEQIQKLTKH